MNTRTDHFITVVSGLPRSGTSMMMKMLDSGDMPLLIDRIRKADEDNPKGYYEYERVKDLEKDNSWLDLARGRAIKIVSPLLYYLKQDAACTYKIIFMLRDLDEILASQKKMAERLNNDSEPIRDNILKEKYSQHLEDIYEWLGQKEDIEVLFVQYTDVLENPLAIAEGISEFLGIELNVRKMAGVTDASLYRQRAEAIEKADCNAALNAEEDRNAIIERLKQLNYM